MKMCKEHKTVTREPSNYPDEQEDDLDEQEVEPIQPAYINPNAFKREYSSESSEA